MARPRTSLKRMLLVSGVAAVTLLSSVALAADNPQSTTQTTDRTTRTTNRSTTKETTSQQQQTTTRTVGTSTQTQTAVITPTGNTQTGNTGTMPTLTSTSKLDLPTLSTANTAIPTYPAPSVPPTQNAPFMQHSSLPNGTVFIAVGTILGTFGVAILVWRALVAYLLHRSIARAALAQHAATDKAAFAGPVPFYKYSDRDPSLNGGAGGPYGGPYGGGSGGGGVGASGTARGARRAARGPSQSFTPSQTNLFFSPTAPGASGLNAGGNRDSRLLPAGFYAASSVAPASGMQGPAIGMTNLRPESVSHGRASPPDSPNFGPLRAAAAARNTSTSSLSLNRPPSGRAPSAYLDDLLDDQPQLVPPGPGPSHSHSYSHSSYGGGRY